MRLWGVFTSTLGITEPSAHFKERLQEIVGLSKSVLTFPKNAAAETHQHQPQWRQIIIATALAALLTMCGWYAGHTSGSLDHQQLATRVAQSDQELSSSRLAMHQQEQRAARVDAALTASGQAGAVTQLAASQEQVKRLEAEVKQYKALLSRGNRGEDNRKDLLLLLSSPQARLVPLKGTQVSPQSLAYALIIPNSKLILVASNLSDLPAGREYQLWILRKTDSKLKSAGIFISDEGGHAYVQVDDSEIVSDPEALYITEEPAGGNGTPSGPKLLVSEE